MAKRNQVTPAVLVLLAREQNKVARELTWLVQRSLECLRAGLDGRDGYAEDGPDSGNDLWAVVRARARAEEEEVRGPDPVDGFGTEVLCLIASLQGLALSYSKASEKSILASTAETRGRRPTPRNTLSSPARAKLRPGRKLRISIRTADLLEMVRVGRDQFSAKTRRETLRSVAEWSLELDGDLPPPGWRREKEVNAAMVNLEKRVSAALPKSTKK